ncbi:bifunctional 2-dehydro-3-deoxygluconokinase/2-dehydro-3-deoxygalactonokinase [Halorarius litoreus]|uniref:bifunctional 2-dehydro-3-deoxygluconokinase/2-dehydro-3- deoxygalactonokinase n=1 Tax=Halorarius litoreus TaxID=2962676 RepID=UPI0020CD042E|nr:bifunctional 2-dehydro-3-deoxygluconokinase/2-dehydro-3-deoxygalactonokinase [Halorarius litoreus]
MPDLLTFGETMLRLTPPADERIEAADTLAVHVGGAESNVAVAAQRLGVDAAWASKLPDSPPAERIVRAIREQGVDPLIARGEGRVGTYYLETGDAPRGSNVVYDREGAAVRTATPDDLPLDRLRDADIFYTSGITPALSETLVDTVVELFAVANDAGTEIAFDLNYRAKLWSPEAARDTLRGLLPAVDTLVVAERDAATVLERGGDAESVARDLTAEYDCETAVVTRGAEGALAVHDGTTHEQPVFDADSPYPVGTGDAFVGGFLARRLRGGSVPEALEYAAATAALKRTIPGDMAQLSPEEVAAVVAGEADEISR